MSASVFEVVATFRFLVTILGVPQSAAANRLAGLAIGLTLPAIHIVGISTTGVSSTRRAAWGRRYWWVETRWGKSG